MKRLLTVLMLVTGLSSGYSNTFIYLYGGTGVAATSNYNMGLSGGTGFQSAISNGFGLGANVFLQQYNVYYSKQVGSVSGNSFHHTSNYVFFAPTFSKQLSAKAGVMNSFFVSAGVGMKMGTTDTVRSWANGNGVIHGYDSVYDASTTATSMVMRISAGLSHHFGGVSIKKHKYIKYSRLGFSLREEVAFTPTKLNTFSVPGNTELNNSAERFMRPLMFNITFGIYINAGKN